MEKKVYLINCLTNMHAGSGEVNFNIIDNQVQRDLITNYPTINSSSLKGALRDFARAYKIESENEIFGSEAGATNNKPGTYSFFSANLLAIPVRSNKKPFFKATTVEILKEFIGYCKKFDVELSSLESIVNNIKVEKDKPVIFEEIKGDCVLEDYVAVYKKFEEVNLFKELLGENIVIFHQENFKNIINNLPVIARNQLVNGKGDNLWYEEVVPRESQFYFGVMSEKSYEEFDKLVEKEMVQIGANGSIGYGYCKLTKKVGDK